jgi:hypothetical protein
MALPDDVPYLARLRDLTATVREAVADPASTAAAEADEAGRELWALREKLDREPRQLGLDDASTLELFGRLGDGLAEVYNRESDAVRALATIPL